MKKNFYIGNCQIDIIFIEKELEDKYLEKFENWLKWQVDHCSTNIFETGFFEIEEDNEIFITFIIREIE